MEFDNNNNDHDNIIMMDQTYTNSHEHENDFKVLGDALLVLLPYMCVSLTISFILHYLLFQPIATHFLLEEYEKDGIPLVGKILSSSTTASPSTNGTTKETVMVEVLYEAPQHRYAKTPRMKLKHPHAYDTKHFVQTFDISSTVALANQWKSSSTEAATTTAANNHKTKNNNHHQTLTPAIELRRLPEIPQSAYPLEVIQTQLEMYKSSPHQTRIKTILGCGVLLWSIDLGIASQQIKGMVDTSAGWSAW
eukprot:CAMPEP_0195299806 /NCGR_PEP_ID=MMETSP0707-20130614/26223_1 /TAXON_ID=33640 /ORGANISM="Asterionellopsis glacialis, Strain CCMP134" /LENGTH=249 /DNA_ID=CAMNT_0040362309 /DNA_START=319 /DNA_END=1065 /DNA_ORIENTATION=-